MARAMARAQNAIDTIVSRPSGTANHGFTIQTRRTVATAPMTVAMERDA